MDGTRVRIVVVVVVVVGIAVAGAAYADTDDADDRNEATRLFEEGRRLDEAGDSDAACKKFEKSYRLDPAPGTALNLGACAEREREWRRAWELYDAAATMLMSKSDKRARFARDRADRVLADHRADVEAQPVAAPEVVVKSSVRYERRTGLKVLAGVSLGVAAIAGAIWIEAFTTYDKYAQGSVDGVDGPLYVPGDCDAAFINTFDPAAQQFEAACDAHDRMRIAVPLTLATGIIGSAALVYLLATDPKPIVVTPSVSGTSAGVTATFEW